ncbi:MAG TPA: hypothetical protein VFB63_24895 [Bryobacteraceae bacterium]|nr:hypothetical protein [Bryobacteraceae bacterium]
MNGILPTWAQEFFVVSGHISLKVLALLCFSGPVVPLAATLFLKKASVHCFRRNRSLLVQLGILQALSFGPYLVAEAFDERNAHHALIIPFAMGVVMFVVTFAYSVHFVVSAIKGRLETPVG